MPVEYDIRRIIVKEFDEKCEFRYDEKRIGDTRKGVGQHTISDRCILKSKGNRKCSFIGDDHITCPMSVHKKHKTKPNTIRFRGRQKKIRKKGGL